MSNILTFPKDSNERISANFTVGEFRCKCPQCPTTQVDPDLVALLEKIREKTGPLLITSGYRCQHYQDELRSRGYETAVGISQHQLGRAADVTTPDSRYSGATLETIARSVGFKAVGVGQHWVHVDLRGLDDGKERRWIYKY